MFLDLVLVLLLLSTFHYYWKTRTLRKLFSLFKSDFIEFPILGQFHMFTGCRNREDIMTVFQTWGRQAIKHDGISKFWSVHMFYLVVADPVIAEVVLRSALEKDDIMTGFGEPLFGNGVIVAPVPIWRNRRRTDLSLFSTRNLKEFQKTFSKESEITVEQLRPLAGSGPFSVWTYLTTFAMDSICENILGVNMQTQANHEDAFLKNFSLFSKLAVLRLVQLWLHSDFIYAMTANHKKMKRATNFLQDFIFQITKSRTIKMENDTANKSDFYKQDLNGIGIKTILDLRKKSPDDDKGYSDLEIVEEALTLLIGGTDTSATGTAFTLLLLSKHPDVQEKLYQELKWVFDDSSRSVEADDLPHLKYLDAVIRESIRLYPPVPFVARKTDKDIKLPSGVTVCKGTNIMIHLWAINRNPRYWGADAESFRPERFLDTAFKHPAQFISFSYGPRNCIGYQYAMLSMKTQLATLLRHYRVLPASIPDNADSDACTAADPAQTAPLRVKFEIMMKEVGNFKLRLESIA